MKSFTTTVKEQPSGLFAWTLEITKPNINAKHEKVAEITGTDVSLPLAMEAATRVAQKLVARDDP